MLYCKGKVLPILLVLMPAASVVTALSGNTGDACDHCPRSPDPPTDLTFLPVSPWPSDVTLTSDWESGGGEGQKEDPAKSCDHEPCKWEGWVQVYNDTTADINVEIWKGSLKVLGETVHTHGTAQWYFFADEEEDPKRQLWLGCGQQLTFLDPPDGTLALAGFGFPIAAKADIVDQVQIKVKVSLGGSSNYERSATVSCTWVAPPG